MMTSALAIPDTMRRWEIQGTGIDQLALVTAPVPEIAANDVLVRVLATSLNYRDLLMVEGRYRGRPGRSGLVPLSDGAGEIVALGSAVTTFAPGHRVAGCFFSGWPDGPWRGAYAQSALGGAVDGMLSEYVALPAAAVVPLPVGYSCAQGAALPCAAVTAFNALVTRGRLQAGETVLVQGSGGVSLYALQMALAVGAKVIAITSSDDKAERLRAMGAHTVINYTTTPEWDKPVLEASGGNGVELVVEVGGAGTLERSIRALAHGGRIAQVGVLAGTTQAANPFGIAMKNADMLGIYVGSRTDFLAMNAFLELHGITPVIDRVFAFEEVPAAYAHMKAGAHMGKVVIAGSAITDPTPGPLAVRAPPLPN